MVLVLCVASLIPRPPLTAFFFDVVENMFFSTAAKKHFFPRFCNEGRPGYEAKT